MPISPWMATVREKVGHDLVVTVGASAIVYNEDRTQILLQRRSDNGKWGVPGGGIEPGEHPAQAAVRETYEETGMRVEVTDLVGVFGGKEQIKAYPNGDVFAYIAISFACKVIGGEIDPDPDETLEARWWDVDALPENFSEVHHKRLDVWRVGKIPAFPVPKPIVPIVNTSNYIREIREKVGSLMLLSPGATILIFNDAGEVLVQRRTDDSLWNFPGGAYEPGEEIAETAIREAYEETGLLIKPVRLVGVYGGEDYIHTYANGETMAYINSVFVCEIVGGALQKDSESSALRFVQPDNLPEPFTDKHRELIVHAMTREADNPYFVR